MFPTSEDQLWHADPDASKLPVYVRFTNLKKAGIVGNWSILQRLISEHAFPTGVMLSKNVRAWPLDQVTAWCEARPTAKKVIKVTDKHVTKTGKHRRHK